MEKVKEVSKVVEKKETVNPNQLIKSLLKEYNTLPKKNNPTGHSIRRRLRRLGYYLSKENKSKINKLSKETKISNKE